MLDSQTLVKQAQEQTGLQEFGSVEWQPAFQALVASLNQDGDLSQLGEQLQNQRLTELLKNRLRLHEFTVLHPEILEESLTPPVIILGLPRTGTTMLQRLLSTDKRFLPIRWYEVRFPVPELDWDFKDEHDKRIPMAKAEVAAMIDANPELPSIHPFDAMAADEDIMLLENAFVSGMPASQTNTVSYNEYYEKNDALAAYQDHKKLLQFLQWQRRRSGREVDGKPWLLKTPAHMYTIDAVLATYPEAKFISSHRNPLACIPSIASLYYAAWQIYCQNPNPHLCGDYTSRYFGTALQRALQAAKLYPKQFLDVEYEDLVNKQDQTLASIYEFLGWPLSDDAQLGFKRWRSDNRRDKRKPHNYDLAQYGLNETELKQQFLSYGKAHKYFD